MLRDAYIAWTRKALPVLLLPLALTAVVQALAASPGWASGPDVPLGMRSMFIAVAVASLAWGRATRQTQAAAALRPLSVERLVSLSWRLVVVSLLPSAIGTVLAMMTRNTLDFYALLAVTLLGTVVLYPRYDQWIIWSSPTDRKGT